jgi:hypothetical protein
MGGKSEPYRGKRALRGRQLKGCASLAATQRAGAELVRTFLAMRDDAQERHDRMEGDPGKLDFVARMLRIEQSTLRLAPGSHPTRGRVAKVGSIPRRSPEAVVGATRDSNTFRTMPHKKDMTPVTLHPPLDWLQLIHRSE